MTLKKGFCLQVFVIRFISQWIKRSKCGLHVFPPKKKCNMKKAFFDWPIVLQYKVKAKYGLISGKFFELNQPKTIRVGICSTNQSNHSISICLFFLFCLQVFISRLYEIRCNCTPQYYLN